MSQALRYHAKPQLRSPVLVLAYAGWSDGGESATSAATFALESLAAERLATLDLEEFLDFTVVRPHVRTRQDASREIVWPAHEFYSVQPESPDIDLVIGLGVEPHMRWRSYCSAVLELVETLEIERVILLGGFLDEVIYSQPIEVMGFSSDPEAGGAGNLVSSGYEGPTGIVGVLGDALRERDTPTVSLWARLPHYVTKSPNWRGSLALLQKLETVLDFPLDLSSLETLAAEFDEEVSETISNDPQLLAYVRELKRRAFSQ